MYFQKYESLSLNLVLDMASWIYRISLASSRAYAITLPTMALLAIANGIRFDPDEYYHIHLSHKAWHHEDGEYVKEVVELVYVALSHPLALLNQLVEEEEATRVVMVDEVGEAEVGDTEGGGEGKLDHHVIDTTGGGIWEDEVGGDSDEDAQEEKDGPRDHCVSRCQCGRDCLYMTLC